VTKHFCDYQSCGAPLGPDGLIAKSKRGPGKLGGREIHLCGEHAVEVERFILGRPDEDQAPKPRRKPAA